MSERIGFIGLGDLGSPMAVNLLDRGYTLTVYNRTSSKTALVEQCGAAVVNAPIDVVEPGGIIVTVLWDADAV